MAAQMPLVAPQNGTLIQQSDVLITSPIGGVPAIACHHELLTYDMLVRAANFLRCGCPAVQLVYQLPADERNNKRWEMETETVKVLFRDIALPDETFHTVPTVGTKMRLIRVERQTNHA
jgi:hypothetical protein